MHIRILLPSLFAATLLSTVALAERNDQDEKAPARSAVVKERVVRETRTHEARQREQTKVTQTKVTERPAPDKLMAKRGCATDDGNGCTSSRTQRTEKSTQATKTSAPAMPTKLQSQRGCATDDGSGCTSKSAPSSKDGSKSGKGVQLPQHVVQTDERSRLVADEIMKMRAKVEAERILDMLNVKMCARKGTCGESDDM